MKPQLIRIATELLGLPNVFGIDSLEGLVIQFVKKLAPDFILCSKFAEGSLLIIGKEFDVSEILKDPLSILPSY
jgi:hypothetical protein